MARLLTAAAVLLVLASCATPADDAETAGPQADPSPAVFCNVWPAAREALLASWNEESESDEGDWAVRLEAEIARYDRIVPASLRSDWDRAYAVFTDIADLRFTVGYFDSRIRPEHLAMVFGEVGPDPAIEEAESAIDNIDAWAATSCGDFCSRWDDLEAAVRFEPGFHRGHMLEMLRTSESRELWIEIGDQIVPAAIAGAWQTAASVQTTYLDFVRDRDIENDYTTEDAEAESFEQLTGQSLDRLADRSHRAVDAIHEWRTHNCDEVALTTTGSGPGRLSIALSNDPSVVRPFILLALLPDGADFGSVRSIGDYVAGTCGHLESFEEFAEPVDWSFQEVADRLEAGDRVADIAADLGYGLHEFLQQWGMHRFGIDADHVGDELERGGRLFEVAEAMGFDPMQALRSGPPGPELMTLQPINDDTEYSDEACQFVWEQEAILEPGDYELYVGAYEGDPGDWRFYVAAPTACTTIPVTIGGDTTVEVPPLAPCSVGAVGSDREIQRRSPPVADGDSSLQVRLPTPHGDDAPHGCHLKMAILPSGTTLNDVGRGDAWPSGGVAVGRPPLEHVDPRMTSMQVLVPILAYPATSQLTHLNIDLGEDGSWMGPTLTPTPLSAGEYDLHVEQACLHQSDDDEDAVRSCGMATVDVQGATAVDLPELGDCP